MGNKLSQEWVTLQHSIDQSEIWSLRIKLLTLIIFFTAIVLSAPITPTVILGLVLWLQDAIWKTFQSRTEQRILAVEKCIANASKDSTGMQFHSDWNNNRPSTVALIQSYIMHALKPTVAFPYIILIALIVLLHVV